MKIVRSGRHTQPSQVEKVAEKAGKAAPVMAISAGALVAVPHGHAVAPAKHGTVAVAVTTARTQTGSAGEALANANAAQANSISLNGAGRITAELTSSYQAKHAKAVQSSANEAHAAHVTHLAHVASEAHAAHLANEAHAAHLSHLAHLASETQSANEAQWASEAHAAHLAHLAHRNDQPTAAASSVPSPTTTVSVVSRSAAPTSSGSYSCSGLESLWEQAGGSSGDAFMAAEIAMAESGGNPNAVSPTDDFGLWQINGSHGALATLDPLGNARAAVSISGDGSDWGPWTTFTSGAYSGKC